MDTFHDKLKSKLDSFAFGVYRVTKKFPKEEIYGITSQLRRSALSVVLNYIEGFARVGDGQFVNFLKISYGSLKKSKIFAVFLIKRRLY